MCRFVFTLFTDPLGLPISPILEYVILAVIYRIAYKIAWKLSPGGILGSEIHWFVRVIAFCTIWAITYGIIWVCKWISGNGVLVVGTVGIGVLVVGIIVVVFKMKDKRKAMVPKI